jgi:hypothetical protein
VEGGLATEEREGGGMPAEGVSIGVHPANFFGSVPTSNATGGQEEDEQQLGLWRNQPSHSPPPHQLVKDQPSPTRPIKSPSSGKCGPPERSTTNHAIHHPLPSRLVAGHGPSRSLAAGVGAAHRRLLLLLSIPLR